MQTSLQGPPESAEFDELIAKLKKAGENESELLIEHLETAHAYLLGAMPRECAHNLQLAQEIAERLPSAPGRAEVKQCVAGLLRGLQLSPQAQASPQSPGSAATARDLSEFFHGADVSLGIFYPKKHVVAVFRSLGLARAGYRALCDAGFRIGEAVAVPGDEVEKFLDDLRVHRHLWADLMTELSRLLDTEASLVDRYTQWARHGSGFLVAYSPTEADAERVSALLQPFDPIAMHWFTASSIRHLV